MPAKSKLDALCRAMIFERDGHRCRKCGKADGKLDWSHYLSRRFLSTRWHPLNSCVMCAGCHLMFHHRPSDGVDWWRSSFPGVDDALRPLLGSKVNLRDAHDALLRGGDAAA